MHYYKTNTTREYSELEIKELIIKLLKENNYLTVGLVVKETGINFPAAQRILCWIEEFTEVIERKKFDMGKIVVSVWFKK